MANVQKVDGYTQSDVQMEGAQGVRMRMLVGPEHNAPNFHMRQFEVAPGGNTPHHHHDYEHEVFVLGGKGIVRTEAGDKQLEAGTVVYMPPNEKHQFVNQGDEALSFLCLIPAPKDCTK
jgi:quercetin dioxygenase-like cupin family protein